MLFAKAELSEYTRQIHEAMHGEVHNAQENYLLNVNETEFVDYLIGKYRLEPIVLHMDKHHITACERDIPAEQHPSTFHFRFKDSAPRQVITYHVPFTGTEDLLHCRASTFLMWSPDAELRSRCISFDIINFRNDPEEVKREAGQILGNLQTQVGHIAKDVEAYNAHLPDQARSVFLARKKQLLERGNFLDALGVPVKKSEGAAETFSVPVSKTAVVVRPKAPTEAFAPEPALDDSVYRSILKMLHDYGVEMERHPDIYANKGEEALRDHFLMMLSPHFQSATGETFNRAGKTDILIRHEGQNVFVAECKFWHGIKAFHATIDQLLGYLTWRDSKAATVCFVSNKELAPVLRQIQEETPTHPCCMKLREKRSEAWMEFDFHLKEDSSRGVRLAILCFHFPGT